MIRAIFFDLDGVLTYESRGSAATCASLCSTHQSLDIEQVLLCYREHFGHLTVEDGSFTDCMEQFSSCIGVNITEEDMQKALIDVTPNTEMFALVKKLQEQYITGIITDNASQRLRLLEASMHLPKMFDPIIVSGDVHSAKIEGTRTIFERACEVANCTPNESVFIDNQKKNLVTPQAMGMHAYWHDDTKNDVSALQAQLAEWGVAIS